MVDRAFGEERHLGLGETGGNCRVRGRGPADFNKPQIPHYGKRTCLSRLSEKALAFGIHTSFRACMYRGTTNGHVIGCA